MHIAYTQKAWSVAPFIVALLGAAFFSIHTAHAQVTAEEASLFQAQLALAEGQVAGLMAHRGKVLGVSTLALTEPYKGSYSSILEQINALRTKIQNAQIDTRGTSTSNASNGVSVAARKAAIVKQMDAIDDRIEALQEQKAQLQAQLDKLNVSATTTNPKNSKGISITHESDAATKSGEKGVYKMEFAVKAKDADVYIKDSAVMGAFFSKTAGANFIIEKKGTSTTKYQRVADVVQTMTTGTSDVTFTSNATKSGSYYKIAKGESKTFTLSVTYKPTKSGMYQMKLVSVNWNTSALNAAKRTTARVGDFTTDLLAL